MEEVLFKPLKEITRSDELIELFHALPEKHIEKLLIIRQLRQQQEDAVEEEKAKIQQHLRSVPFKKQEELVLSALQIPWGDWSRVYRVRGLPRAIDFIEDLLRESGATDPNQIYNLAFLNYIAYSFFRDEKGGRIPQLRERALELALQARDIYKAEELGKLEHFVTRMGSILINEWRKNLPEYCTSLTCNIIALISLIDYNYDKALIFLNEAFESHPTPPEIYFTLGIYFLRKRMFNPAIRMFNESIKRKGEHSAEAYYQLGRAYHLKSQFFIDQLDPESKDRRKQKRLRELIDRRIAKALDAFQASLSEDPYFSLPYYWMGLTHLLKDECTCDQAIELIQIGLNLDPKTIYRYLQNYPLICRAPNLSCNQQKLIAWVKESLSQAGKDRPTG
jgi:hypothetical protein